MNTFALVLLVLAYGAYPQQPETVNINMGGYYFVLPLEYGETVADKLQALGIETYHYAGEANRLLSHDDTINLPNLNFQITYQEQVVPYETMAIINPYLYYGDKNTTVSGREGLEILYNLTIFHLEDEISTITKETRMVAYPSMAFVELGSKEPTYIDTYMGRFRVTGHFIAEATAYSPEQTNLSNYTASGIRLTPGIAAVDPAVVALGTYVYVPGYGLFLAADTGGSIRGYTIDLSFATIREALNFGRKEVEVFVLDKTTDLF